MSNFEEFTKKILSLKNCEEGQLKSQLLVAIQNFESSLKKNDKEENQKGNKEESKEEKNKENETMSIKKTSGPKRSKRSKKRKNQTGRGGMIEMDPIAGTRDFAPNEYRYRQWLFEKFRTVSKSFGFQEYDCPILEEAVLYKRKAGEEITEQMYNFKDKSGLEVALRPEMTPSLARMILKLGKTLLQPVRWFSIPQCWRYETTTRGRKREHFQWNMDIWGIKVVSAEAELIAALVTFFKSVGLNSKDIGIKFSSRKVLQAVLLGMGIPKESFPQVCVIIDKLDKLESNVVIELLGKANIEEELAKKIVKVTAVKTIEELEEVAGKSKELDELKLFSKLVEGYGFKDWIIFDFSIVRGLAYYTGIVFEGFARQGTLQRAVCGGGRYDEICAIYGAKNNIPACGFGFGDVVILEILKEKKILPKLEHTVDDLIIPFDESFRPQANKVAAFLRENGRTVDVYLKKVRLKQAYSYADRVGAKRAVLIAPSEWEDGESVGLKFLRIKSKKNQFTVPYKNIPTFIPPVEQENKE